MKQMLENFAAYLDDAAARCAERERDLIADERKDEAIFEKIRANVYGIFRSVLDVAVENCGEDADKLCDFFSMRLERIPAGWGAAYEAARDHDDAGKVKIEEIKLAAVQEIKTEFMKIREGSR